MNILLHCSWQSYNIGDIAHTPGCLAVLNQHLPDASISLLPGPLNHGADTMLARQFPSLTVLDPDDNAQVTQAFDRADLLLHGSGPNLIRPHHLRRWISETGKPYGALGSTLEQVHEHNRDLVEAASFIFTRETASLEVIRQAELARRPIVDFAPDATAGMTIIDEAAGQRTLEQFGLKPKSFVCAVPRLRYTPYHEFKPSIGWDADRIAEVERVNEQHKLADHARLVHAIRVLLEQTDLRVLLCPEMTYQVPLLEQLLRDPLPAALRDRVHNLGRYWLPDAAAAVYGQAASVISMECHSPLFALARGTPCIHLRQPEDTIKGQMYHDLGLGDWLFEIDTSDPDEIAAKLVQQVDDPTAVLGTVNAAQSTVRERLASAAEIIRNTIYPSK